VTRRPTSETVVFPNARGQRLAGTIHLPASDARGGAVVCHGMLSSRASDKHVAICEALAARSVLSLRFDFAGRGESEGRLEDLSFHTELEDLDAAMLMLEARTDRIALVGSSMGGAVAVLHAARRPHVLGVAALAAVARPMALEERLAPSGSGPRSEREGMVEVRPGLRVGPQLFRSARQVDVIAAARSLQCPLLVVHGGRDEVVPADQARELFDAASRGRLELLAGADHLFGDPEDRARLVALVAEFVVSVLDADEGRGA